MTIIYPLDYNKTDTMLTVYFYISVCSSISTGEIREKRKRCKYIKGKYILNFIKYPEKLRLIF